MNVYEWLNSVLGDENYSVDDNERLYQEAKDTFGITTKFDSFCRQARRVRSRIREEQNEEDNDALNGDLPEAIASKWVENKAQAVYTASLGDFRSVEEVIKTAKIDLTKWSIKSSSIETKNNATSKVKIEFSKNEAERTRIPTLQPVMLPNIKRKDPPAKSLDNVITNHLIIADAQIGFNRTDMKGGLVTYHDRAAMDAVLKLVADNNFDEIIVNGDMLDATEASRFTQKPEFAGTLQPAINELGWYLEQLRKAAPFSKIIFIVGNHEVRIRNQAMENMRFAYNLTPYKAKHDILSLNSLLRFDTLDIELIEDYPNGCHWIGNNVRVIHGEFIKIETELNMSKTSCIMGHLHKIATKSKTNFYKGGYEISQVHTSGCLCKLDGSVPGSSARSDWQQGIVQVEHAGATYNINHIPIVLGQAMYKGKIYQGVEYELEVE